MCKACRSAAQSKDITNQRFGRLVAIQPVLPPRQGGKSTSWGWRCRCDCSSETLVRLGNLTSGKTTSCGCARSDAVKTLYLDGTAPCKLSESSHPRATNTSGVAGVWRDSSRGMWAAEIVFRGEKYFLGRYTQKQDAIAARRDAEKRIFKMYLEDTKEKK